MRHLFIFALTMACAPIFLESETFAREISPVELTVEAKIVTDQSPSSDGLSNVVLTIHNGDAGLRSAPPTIALRAVYWAEDGEDVDIWNGPLAGVDAENEDGTIDFISASFIAHTADTTPMTTRAFERGLLLVNEVIQVSRPTNITRAVTRELVVRYAVIPRDAANDLLVPVDHQEEGRTVFGPIDGSVLERRQGQGGLGLLQGADGDDQPSLEVIEERLDVQLTFTDGTSSSEKN